MKVRFIRFLKDSGAYTEFIRYFEEKFGKGYLNLYFKDLPPSMYVLCAFVWDDTESGNKYWSKIDHEWDKICKGEDI